MEDAQIEIEISVLGIYPMDTLAETTKGMFKDGWCSVVCSGLKMRSVSICGDWLHTIIMLQNNDMQLSK